MDANRIEQRSGGDEVGRVARQRAANADAPAERPVERRPEAQPVRHEDRVEVSRAMTSEMADQIRRHRERLERNLEGRRELVDAVRKLMSSGAYDTIESARRAADGMLRRGA